MCLKIASWVNEHMAKRRKRSFAQGEIWAHSELLYGRGHLYVESCVEGATSAYAQGVRHALALHAQLHAELLRVRRYSALEQRMLGRIHD